MERILTNIVKTGETLNLQQQRSLSITLKKHWGRRGKFFNDDIEIFPMVPDEAPRLPGIVQQRFGEAAPGAPHEMVIEAANTAVPGSRVLSAHQQDLMVFPQMLVDLIGADGGAAEPEGVLLAFVEQMEDLHVASPVLRAATAQWMAAATPRALRAQSKRRARARPRALNSLFSSSSVKTRISS